jgi:hypothetical protein
MAQSNSLFSVSDFNIHFNPDGFYNGKNSWLSDDGTIKVIWNSVENYWVLSGDSLGSTVVFNKNPEYPPINGNWEVLGSNYSVKENQGLCEPLDLLKFTTNSTNPGCICDGTITVSATGGVAPYQYSYNNGFTYGYSPLMTDLCGGEHIVKVKDAENRIVTQMITMPDVKPETTYTVSMDVESETYPTTTTTKTVYKLKVVPLLPPGVTLTFNLIFNGRGFSTPYQTSVVTTFIPQVVKNTNTLIPTDNTTLTNEPYNGACAGTIYFTNYSFTYQSFTMDNDDIISIELLTGIERVCGPGNFLIDASPNEELGPLSNFILEDYATTPRYVTCCNGGLNQKGYAITGPTIAGCNCCKVVGVDYYWTRS